MYTPTDTTTPPRSGQVANPAHPSASKLVSAWARGRRHYTPWAPPRLRLLAAIRFTVGIFLVGLATVMISYGHDGLAAAPLAGAALLLSIASLDLAAARSASPRT
jgi:hypothetical protein